MIFEKIVSLLSEQLGVDAESITMETSFEELGADSVDVVDLTMAVEEAFNLEDLADENLSEITTVGDFVNFLKTKVDEE
ncbi:MAG TPA: acyl carrier protein [Candidatus Flavonifractor merdipullorum]|uniref:Acyl carrier protein n=1 Tax=Candidatus Flavonifractor merdipullorum TaxID=2838590 RepID=A0A9D1RTI8_9FIRM|nr:acyl carrier protein [Candidatus Flavonifractor merdipullorum]